MRKRPFSSLQDRLADQARAKQTLFERLKQPKKSVAEPPAAAPPPSATTLAQAAPAPTPTRPWAHVRVTPSRPEYFDRTASEQIRYQPWTLGIVDRLLEAAALGTTHLCLTWPAKAGSLATLHALANVQRIGAKDLRGMRTILYPGTHATRAGLDDVLVARSHLSDDYLAMLDGTTLKPATASKAMEAVLVALNNIRNRHPELPNPSFAEIIPSFVYDSAGRTWATTVNSPLERTLLKVDRTAYRQELRQRLVAEWSSARDAPCALMVLHYGLRKDGLRSALSGVDLRNASAPEVLLCDATQTGLSRDPALLKRIPEAIKLAGALISPRPGCLVVTDDPRAYFILRAQLRERKIEHLEHVWVAEGNEWLLSPGPQAADWAPAVRSNSNFSVGIVDRDAAELAGTLQRLAGEAGNEEHLGYQTLMNAFMYVMRLCNLPAGYSDLTALSAEDARSQLRGTDAWLPIRLAIEAQLSAGGLAALRPRVEKALKKVDMLIDAWGDATPMALRLLSEIQTASKDRKAHISVVVSSKRYIMLAHRFLSRKLGDQWKALEPHVEWHTLASVSTTLSDDVRQSHFVFIGLNADVLRILVTHRNIPHGTAVLVAYRQAKSAITTLQGIKEQSAFKAYRGRAGLLLQELERRVAQVPNPHVFEKLKDSPLSFSLDAEPAPASEHAYYRFELEGGGTVFASGSIYKYSPSDDPPFVRVSTNQISIGDLVFRMSDELRADIEVLLDLQAGGMNSVVDPVRTLLKLYHTDIQTRCEMLFGSKSRQGLARSVHEKMTALDASASECPLARVDYWLDLHAEGDNRPHAPREQRFFKVFCKALGISDESTARYWQVIRSARYVNQWLGRELVARYAEILFQPESAVLYRKLSPQVLKTLQQAALRCVYRVENVVPPTEGR